MKKITELPKSLIDKGYKLEIVNNTYQLYHNNVSVGIRNTVPKLINMPWSRERDRYFHDRELFNLEKMELI